MKRICVLAVTVCVGFLASCSGQRSVPVEATSHAPKAVDRSSPEMTLRTFWSAVRSGDRATALACAKPTRIRQGRHGRDVEKLIEEYRNLDSSEFRYLASQGRCSIRSPTHNMDYDMEKNDAGEWIIVSIHP